MILTVQCEQHPTDHTTCANYCSKSMCGVHTFPQDTRKISYNDLYNIVVAQPCKLVTHRFIAENVYNNAEQLWDKSFTQPKIFVYDDTVPFHKEIWYRYMIYLQFKISTVAAIDLSHNSNYRSVRVEYKIQGQECTMVYWCNDYIAGRAWARFNIVFFAFQRIELEVRGALTATFARQIKRVSSDSYKSITSFAV